jgi:cell division protein FtsL
LKSRSKPQDLRELKKIEWEDLSDKSSRRNKKRRSVGEYMEKRRERMRRSVTDRIVKIEKLFLLIFAILAA